MSRRNPPARWVLPAVIDPPRRRCFQIEVPDEPQHIAAFRGAMLDLASAYKWADDPLHKARLVADVWKRVITNMRSCDPIPAPDRAGTTLEDFMSQTIRISPDDPCVIQMWCIDHWEDWYDPRPCIGPSVVQPGDGGELANGRCLNFSAVMPASGKWLLPVQVSTGDVITVTNSQGVSSDGGITDWFCADGGQYLLGACTGLTTLLGGDPIPTLAHNRLIMALDGGPYLDGYNRSQAVPAGLTDVNLIFQVNDSSLAGNDGSLSFDVQVCRAAAAFSITYYLGLGSGPSTAVDGETINIDGVFYAPTGHYTVYAQFSPCCKVEVLGATGFTASTAPGAVYWTWTPCGGSLQQCSVATSCDGSDPTVFDASLCVSDYQLISSTPFTLIVKITDIGCT